MVVDLFGAAQRLAVLEDLGVALESIVGDASQSSIA
jgi:hypothetical protein